MPRPGPRRPLVNVRLSEAGVVLLRQRAEQETDGNVSELMRRMLTYASMKMPKGWNESDDPGQEAPRRAAKVTSTFTEVSEPPAAKPTAKAMSKAEQARQLREARYRR